MVEKLSFPSLKIVKASAGSGKTYYLTKTYVEYLLSDSIKFNDLKNILAITFSNNAAIEIKERILKWLKDIYFDREEARNKLTVLANSEQELVEKAQILIEKILNNYSDFQIRTIDSFMTKIFKAEALSFGYPGDFEILMNPKNFVKRAFENYLSRFSESSDKCEYLINLVDTIERNQKQGSSFIWNPGRKILREIEEIQKLISKNPDDFFTDLESKIRENEENLERAKRILRESAKDFENLVNSKGKKYNGRSNIEKVLKEIERERYTAIFDTTFNTCPVSKADADQEIIYAWEELREAVANFVIQYCISFFNPYLLFLLSFREYLQVVKWKEQKIFIDDINRMIGERLSLFLIPEIYIKLGERIFHFFIDEFQDTSPIQWKNLKILIEDSLAKGGSLLLVGDTKQAIYGFRGADYMIMKGLLSEASAPSEFSSVSQYEISPLDTNYRSGEIIIEFVRYFFKEKLKEHILSIIEKDKSNKFSLDERGEPLLLGLSGLYECEQKVKEELKEIGYVEIEKISYDAEDEEETKKEALLRTIDRLKNIHSFSYGEIAVLAFENSTLRQISTWLNEEGLNFLSFSSLDIRNRKIISEIVYLLRFLDSPIDDFSFSIFLNGEVAKREFEKIVPKWQQEIERFLSNGALKKREANVAEPYYKIFMENFPTLWQDYFAELVKKVGFLPFYDLVSEVYQNFRLFKNFPEEEAALIKFLEICSLFDGGLGEFIEFFDTSGDEDETFWDISKPKGKDAITLMTIHKAKGLEFPAVVLFADMDKVKSDGYLYHMGNLMKMPNDAALKNPSLDELKEIKTSQYNRQYAEELNKLYVALTRAKEALYILVPCKVDPKKDSEECSYANEAIKALANIEKIYGNEKFERKLEVKSKDDKLCQSFEIEHKEGEKTSEDYEFSEDFTDFEEIRRGEAIHRVFSEIEFVDFENLENFMNELSDKIERTLFEMKFPHIREDITETIEKILKNELLVKYFVSISGREIFTEKEIVDSEGRLHRVDRLVIDKDMVTVIEFKFGRNPDKEEAMEQTKEYLEIIKSLFPQREIRGLVYFAYNDEVIEL